MTRKSDKHCVRPMESLDSCFHIIFFLCIISIYTFLFIYFFIIQHVKAHVIPYSSSAANQGDNTVSVAKGGTATPGTTKQLLPPDRVFKRNVYIYIYIYIYIYMPDQLKAEITLDVRSSSF